MGRNLCCIFAQELVGSEAVQWMQAGRQAGAERKPNGGPVSHMQAGPTTSAGHHGKKPKPDPDPRPTDPPPPNAKSLSPEAPAS